MLSLLLLFLLIAHPCRAQYDRDVFMQRGRIALSEGKLSEAMTNFNILAQIDTSDHLTFFFRGIAKYNLGDIRGSWKDFDRSVRINPVFTSGYHYRAIASSRMGMYDQALEDLQKAIDLRPGAMGIYFSRGVTYFLSQRFDLAIKDFNKYIRKEHSDPAAYLNRGASYLYLGDSLKAMKDYDKAIKLDPIDPEGYIRRARLKSMLGETTEALEDYDRAIQLDPDNSLAYFNRGLMRVDGDDLIGALSDLDKVLEIEPGNALTLYNRSLIYSRVGDYEKALADIDRVIDINPENVLAYYNRASYFIGMEMWEDAMDDYDRAIELYPDFAKAYMNRSYVEQKLGLNKRSKRDYQIAQEKIREYGRKVASSENTFADTTKKYSNLIAFDADFAKKNFNDEMLQHRDVDIRLRPFYRFAVTPNLDRGRYALVSRYENPMLDRFTAKLPVEISISDAQKEIEIPEEEYGTAEMEFLLALNDVASKQFNSAAMHYDAALEGSSNDRYASAYKAFYLLNRAVLRAEMINFIASMESNVKTLTMDDSKGARARVAESVHTQYDYSEALSDMNLASKILENNPYIEYNLGNLECFSSNLVEAIEHYGKAISAYPEMGDAYFNRGLVQIFLKDKEKGCIDLSRAGELGVKDAYGVISRYCKEEEK